MEKIVISSGVQVVVRGGVRRSEPCIHRADVPTLKAQKKRMYKNKPGAKHKGRRGPFVWDFDLVKRECKFSP